MKNQKWIMEIKVQNPITKELEWKAVHATGSLTPYSYPTEAEAQNMLNICYGSCLAEHCRVRNIA